LASVARLSKVGYTMKYKGALAIKQCLGLKDANAQVSAMDKRPLYTVPTVDRPLGGYLPNPQDAPHTSPMDWRPWLDNTAKAMLNAALHHADIRRVPN